ncbi:MAG TPA: N-acetyltransferase [bacterium]|nr:N-acetyltransferase [bacterium]HPT29986.1 N-acetyltransferase [bacterium]
MGNIVLKRATLKDAKEVLALESSANSRTYSARISEKALNHFIKNEFVFLIRKGSKVVGLISYEVKRGKTMHLNGLVIKPELRGQGFARQALSSLLKKKLGYSRIELVVHPHNTPALTLYLSLGFMIESWQDNYFGDGEPRLLLVKK